MSTSGNYGCFTDRFVTLHQDFFCQDSHSLFPDFDNAVRTRPGAQRTADAQGFIRAGRGAVPFAVEMVRHHDDFLGAHYCAEFTPFASFFVEDWFWHIFRLLLPFDRQ